MLFPIIPQTIGIVGFTVVTVGLERDPAQVARGEQYRATREVPGGGATDPAISAPETRKANGNRRKREALMATIIPGFEGRSNDGRATIH
jgi:hypothetical protein